MRLDSFFIFLLVVGCLFIVLTQMNNDKEIEIEIIKNSKEYVIYKNCENFKGDWYCYD